MAGTRKKFISYLANSMKTFFEILPESFYEEDCSLICEISNEGISCAIKNLKEQKYIGIAVYNFDKSRPQAGFQIALQILFNTKPFFSKKYQSVIIVYSTPESVLIPFQLYDSRSSPDSLKLVFGDLYGDYTIISDLVTESGYYNCYRVRNELQNIVEQQFPGSLKWHQYSVLLGRHSSDENKMFVIFYTYKMVVTVFKNGKCILVNSFNYHYAEDVSYYLLSIRKESGFDDLPLEVSGFIEKDSSLYLELYKYFQEISFSELPEFCEFTEPLLQYPSHYFSHLFSSDPCG